MLYCLAVETKDDLIKATIRELLRIAEMYARVEKMPIEVEEGLEVSTREAHTIQAVGEQEPISVTQVADRFGITKSAASQMVTRLAGRGFLQKKRSPHSNKEFELSLTPLGWRAYEAHERFHGEDFRRLLETLSSFSLSQIATNMVLLEAVSSVMRQRLAEEPD